MQHKQRIPRTLEEANIHDKYEYERWLDYLDWLDSKNDYQLKQQQENIK